MKIVIAPSAGKRNPYQSLLVSSLERSGVEVRWPRGFFLPWPQMFRHGLPQVIHLQWHHLYFRSKWLPEAMLRTGLFFGQWLILRRLGVRFVWTVHNLVNHERYQVGWELFACRLLARLVDRIIVHCKAVRSTVSAAYRVSPEKIRVVPHGHYVDWYPPPLSRDVARARLGLANDHRIFLFFGQVRRYKGLDRLLTDFAALPAGDVRLILVGEPRPKSLGDQLEAQAAADPRVVTEFAFIDDERLVAYLCACDLVVLPYRDSLTSGAAVLAASYGRPVLIPCLGCMQEFPVEAAILYDPDQADGLHRALGQALSAPLAGMGSAAKTYIEQFPWSLAVAETFEVYRSVLGQQTVSTRPSVRSKY
jgi:glycosyltransferase involved in cell wall biosynthesis